MKRPLPVPISAAEVRRLAVLACVDPRTILDVAAGVRRRRPSMSAARARRVLIATGYPLPEPQP
jgi:hypothetical protein